MPEPDYKQMAQLNNIPQTVMGMTSKNKLQLIDVNPNGPEYSFNPKKTAECMIRHAISLVEPKNKSMFRS